MTKGIGRKCRIVDCRETAGLAKTGGLAQRNTVAESPSRDVIAIAMGPGRRHITKPICEITYALREENIDTSVIVLNAGSGVPTDAPAQTMGTFGLEPEEKEKIQQFKLAVIHLGNVKNHILYKARLVLRNVDIPAICVTQCPVDFEDFAEIGIKTREVMPPENEIKTKGTIVDIVSGIIRGEACPQSKLDEVIRKVNKNLVTIEKKPNSEETSS